MTAGAPHGSCCTPRTTSADTTFLPPAVALLSRAEMPRGGRETQTGQDVVIPAGAFQMGDAFDEGYPADGETPVHTVAVSSFAVDATPVTNTQFAKFIEATGYRTESEQLGSSAVFHLLVQAKEEDILGPVNGANWWLTVRGADWAHPHGPRSAWKDFAEHPVVHVSWNDAMAYCAWGGRRLPTEAEWEYAARGGLAGKRYAWGDDLHPQDGKHRCNIWQGEFPLLNTEADGYLGTAPVGSFPPNGYGLYDTSGNVWEWCQDWFLPKYYRNSPDNDPQGPTIGAGRVMRGGSYLCHESYCNRYRVAARSFSPADSASGNCGFRTARSLT